MVVPKSQLARFVSDVIKSVQAARADVLDTALIQTDPFKISFSVQVIDDTQPAIEVGVSSQITPETKQTTTRQPTTSTQTQDSPAITSTEEQTTTPGVETTRQAYGRSSVTNVQYTD